MVQSQIIMLGAVGFGSRAGHSHAIIEIGRLTILCCRQVCGCHMAITIQAQHIEHRLNKSLFNTFTQNAATQQQRVNIDCSFIDRLQKYGTCREGIGVAAGLDREDALEAAREAAPEAAQDAPAPEETEPENKEE